MMMMIRRSTVKKESYEQALGTYRRKASQIDNGSLVGFNSKRVRVGERVDRYM